MRVFGRILASLFLLPDREPIGFLKLILFIRHKLSLETSGVSICKKICQTRTRPSGTGTRRHMDILKCYRGNCIWTQKPQLNADRDIES
jgi:hypothetical protein